MDDLCNIIGCSFDIYYGGVVIITQTGCPLDDHFPINLITGQIPVISVNAYLPVPYVFLFQKYRDLYLFYSALSQLRSSGNPVNCLFCQNY